MINHFDHSDRVSIAVIIMHQHRHRHFCRLRRFSFFFSVFFFIFWCSWFFVLISHFHRYDFSRIFSWHQKILINPKSTSTIRINIWRLDAPFDYRRNTNFSKMHHFSFLSRLTYWHADIWMFELLFFSRRHFRNLSSLRRKHFFLIVRSRVAFLKCSRIFFNTIEYVEKSFWKKSLIFCFKNNVNFDK